MIELTRIIAHNFVTHTKLDIPLWKIRDNLIFIDGDNLDSPSLGSNGSGKTLIFDAVSWGNYGQTVRGLKADEVIGLFGKTAYVRLHYKDGQDKVRISRERSKGHTSLSFTINGIDQGGQDAIDKWLMPWKTFRNAIYMGQGDVDRFASATDKERKDIISSIGELFLFDGAFKWVKQQKEQLQFEISRLNNKIEEIGRDRKTLLIELKDAKEKVVKRLEQVNRRIEDAKKELTTLREKIQELQKIPTKIRLVDAKIRKVQKDRFNEVGKFDGTLREIQERREIIREERSRINAQIASVEQNIRALTEEIFKKESLLNKHCPTCGKIMTSEDINNFVGEKKKEKSAKVNDVGICKNNVRKIDEKFSGTVREYNDVITKRGETDTIYQAKLGKLDTERNSLTIQLDEKKDLYRRILLTKEMISDLTGDKDVVNELVNVIRKKLAKLKSKIQFLEMKKDGIIKQYDIAEYWFSAFGPKGIKASAMSDIADEMNDRIGQILDTIVDGDIQVTFSSAKQRKKKITNEFEILVQDSTKPKPVRYQLWSGGEKGRITFAIIVTFSLLVRSKINLLMIDEALDKDLSKVGVSRVVDFIKSMNGRVMVTSQDSAIRSHFGTALFVQKSGGKSVTQWIQ